MDWNIWKHIHTDEISCMNIKRTYFPIFVFIMNFIVTKIITVVISSLANLVFFLSRMDTFFWGKNQEGYGTFPTFLVWNMYTSTCTTHMHGYVFITRSKYFYSLGCALSSLWQVLFYPYLLRLSLFILTMYETQAKGIYIRCYRLVLVVMH